MLSENRITFPLSLPIIAGFVGQMLMGWADSIMLGRVGVLELAACAFGSSISHIFLVFGFGLIAAVSIRASQEFGAGRRKRAGEVLSAGVALSFGGGIVLFLLLLASLPFLGLLGQEAEVVEASKPYIFYVGLSIPFALVLGAYKSFSEALSKPWVPFFVVLGDVLLNVFLNWIFIYGNLGAPAMGIEGAGFATFLARVCGAVVMGVVLFMGPSYKEWLPARPVAGFFTDTARHLPLMLRLGMPSAFQVLGEMSAFSMASLMMGWIGVQALAAHQIALTCAATTFMIPLGISTALTVRIGQARGAEEPRRVLPAAAGAIALSIVVMGVSACVFLLAGPAIARIFVTDAETLRLAALLLVVAGIFQIFDGIQVTSIGGLRGLNDVRFPMVLTYVNYWLVALPLSALFAFGLGLGAVGVWAGLCLALFVAAVILVTRLLRMCFWIEKSGGFAIASRAPDR